jgi:putative nucleotidyltransferase with HDIG domain
MIASSFDLQRNLATLLDFAVARLGVDCATVLLTDPDLNWLKFGVGRGLRTEALGRTQLALGDGHAGRAALEARMIQVPDLQAEPDAARQEALRAEGVVSYIAVPLMVKGRIQGVLEVLHRAALTPEPDWFKFLEALSAQAAIAIENSTLFGQLQKSHAELRNAYDETIVGWSRALDLRDRETEGHTQRVAEMSLELARDFGLDEQALVHMRRGALLHDIGKMGIPDRILLKPSSLTRREWEIMHKHPTLAFEMLSPIAHLRAALDIPYCHHERMDGSGYPRGLQGEQIPLTARIFAVVDIWDALRSDRPYRAAWSRARALRHIKALAGKQLDARVVKAFLMLIKET